MKPTKTLLEKLERILTHGGVKVRYEKGNFRGGFCILQEGEIVVVNKFFPLEGKINTLLEVLQQVSIDDSQLEAEDLKFFLSLRQTKLDI